MTLNDGFVKSGDSFLANRDLFFNKAKLLHCRDANMALSLARLPMDNEATHSTEQ